LPGVFEEQRLEFWICHFFGSISEAILASCQAKCNTWPKGLKTAPAACSLAPAGPETVCV
jgi:hypothetical protein